MSLDALRDALLKMRPTGEEGFEGLVATLLSALTGERFYIARSGDQPADAISQTGGVAIQAKRYRTTLLDETEFEGDFSKACRTCSNLDAYVLAATCETAQLQVLATELEHIHCVDIVLLGFGRPDAELPTLCVTFWDQIRYLPGLDELGTSFAAWAATQAIQSQTVDTVNRLRLQFAQSTSLATSVKRKLDRYLSLRFGTASGAPSLIRFLIDLPQAVMRRPPHRELQTWWSQRKSQAAAVTGEEGMGKSWIAAAFADEIAATTDALVIWLDSTDWFRFLSLEEIVDAGLMLAGISDCQLRERLTRKALRRWSNRLIVVLDGVNERGAREAAHHILAELTAAEKPPCHVVFTARPISWYSDERNLWNLVTVVGVERFTEEEFVEALARLPGSVPRLEVDSSLAEAARIPRYFRRAVELRNQFKSFANVSRKMIVWADLLTKIQEGDRQVTERIGWTSAADTKRALCRLAENARAGRTQSQQSTTSYEILQSSFGNRFEEIRFDLAEQRVVLDPNAENPVLSDEHLVLGFALLLGRLGATISTASVSELADRFRKELEPLESQDQLTEALFVALQLSAFPQAGYELSSGARAALLLAWASSQNALVSHERLDFWSDHDVSAYLGFMEEAFLDVVSTGWNELISSPIARLWRRKGEDELDLAARLRTWLQLVWKSHDLPDNHEFIHAGHKLPVARSQDQLALSFVAVRVLSENPVESFLPEIALAWATDDLCTQRRSFGTPSVDSTEAAKDWPCKDLGWNLGALLRWRYTEMMLPRIEVLRASSEPDGLLQKGLDYMITAFDEFGWSRCSKPEKARREGLPLFNSSVQRFSDRVDDCPWLAVRDDLPELSQFDQAVIAKTVEPVFSTPELHSGRFRTLEDLIVSRYLPWFARYDARSLTRLGSRFRLTALARDDLASALDFANGLPYSSEEVATSEILKSAQEAGQRENQRAEQASWRSLQQLHILALTCLEGDEVQEWLRFSSELPLLRAGFHLDPISYLCARLLPPDLGNMARERAKLCCNEAVDENDITQSEFDFWALIGGLTGEPDSDFHAWVDAEIKRREPKGRRRLYWFLLWFRTATEEDLKKALADGFLLEALAGLGWRARRIADVSVENWQALSADFDVVMRVVPDLAGTLFLKRQRQSDCRRWGNLLFEQALAVVGDPPFEKTFWGGTSYTVDQSSEVVTMTWDSGAQAGSNDKETLRPSGDPSTLLSLTSGNDAEHQANENLRQWRKDQEQLNRLLPVFDAFGSVEALEAWRDMQPEAFLAYARQLLTRATEDPGKAFHLGGFISAVICALIPHAPQLALESHRNLCESALRIKVSTTYGVSTFVAAMWRAAGSGNTDCLRICDQLLTGSQTDEELMYHAVAAQAEGAEECLAQLCKEMLSVQPAKHRCLAVSLLAWIATDRAISTLQSLSTGDQRGWVRKHAEWAVEVARQEASGRRHYQRLLVEPDHNKVLSMLQVLRPALTPAALWWHGVYERKLATFEKAPSRVQAALICFWHGSQNACKKTPELFGRKLSEYLRGERVSDMRSPRIPLR